MSFNKTTIGEHCTVTSSKRFHLSERTTSGVPFYCSKEIIQKVHGETVSAVDYIQENLYETIKKQFGVPEPGDLLITTRGTYGVPYIYKENDYFYFADGNLTWLKDFDDQLLSTYLYYWVNSHEGQKKIDAIAKGTAQKAVPIAAIKLLELEIPNIKVQQKIVNILSAYDNLIENNRKQIELLEEAAQRLYKEWFVDLRFPGYEDVEIADGIPEGWSNIPLGELIAYEIGGGWGESSIKGKSELPGYVIRGTDFQGLTHGKITDIPFRYHTKSNLLSRVLSDRDIVFEVSGGSKTEGVARVALIRSELLEMFNNPVICASFCKLIRFKNKTISQYMYDTFLYLRASGKTAEFDKKSASSIVNYRWKDFLAQEKILVPSEQILSEYNSVAENYYCKILCMSKMIEKLSDARELLLPRLMNEEIEVGGCLVK